MLGKRNMSGLNHVILAITFFILLLSSTTLKAGKVDTLSLYSSAMKKDMKFIVVEPSTTIPDGGFPVVYLLHGMGGTYNLWITKVPALQDAADRFNCIIVCPDGGRTTLYFNNPLDSTYRFESHFIKELIPYVDSHYPTAKDRKFRSIAGLSMGGFGSLFMASNYPELFASAGSMSGALMVDPIARSIIAKSADKTIDSSCCQINWNKLKEYNSGDTSSANTIALALECGTEDYLLAANRSAHRRLTDLKIAHDYTERPGRHNWFYWENAIDYQLLFFRKRWNRFKQDQ
ncbi:alpha/beta hydrolase [Flavihumibacter sp. UBA7668]|uniref:alpha/beta hydrolase n=1 Tax=Flavihumibacter sp. UBA7668 TaxID=1946542 RepID=UPI0025BB9D72|nr:alpha/beta hydrolase-fold protein [Flavihumibacter sp. UBA7668]